MTAGHVVFLLFRPLTHSERPFQSMVWGHWSKFQEMTWQKTTEKLMLAKWWTGKTKCVHLKKLVTISWFRVRFWYVLQLRWYRLQKCFFIFFRTILWELKVDMSWFVSQSTYKSWCFCRSLLPSSFGSYRSCWFLLYCFKWWRGGRWIRKWNNLKCLFTEYINIFYVGNSITTVDSSIITLVPIWSIW